MTLADRENKEIIINSIRFLVKEGRVKVSSFVLMENHFHLIWQVMGEHKREDVQRDFLRYTAQQILKQFRNSKLIWNYLLRLDFSCHTDKVVRVALTKRDVSIDEVS